MRQNEGKVLEAQRAYTRGTLRRWKATCEFYISRGLDIVLMIQAIFIYDRILGNSLTTQQEVASMSMLRFPCYITPSNIGFR